MMQQKTWLISKICKLCFCYIKLYVRNSQSQVLKSFTLFHPENGRDVSPSLSAPKGKRILRASILVFLMREKTHKLLTP